MKIIFVQPSIPLYRVHFFKSLAYEFAENFIVIHSKGDLGELTPSFKYQWSKCIGRVIKIGFGLNWQKNLINYPIKRGDIVVVSGNPRYISSILFILKGKLLGCKILWWGHYRSSTSKTWRIKLRLALMKLADGIIFYTEGEVKRYLNLKLRDYRPIIGLNNGIELIPIKSLRMKYDANYRNQEILFIGRITEKSNFQFLIEALQHPKINNISLNVIGNDVCNSSMKVNKYNFTNGVKINYHGKLTGEKEISKIINRCIIFVYPGSVGLSLIHTMAYGLPSLVHSDPLLHMPEIDAFKEGVTGLTFEPDNLEDFVNKLCWMMSNTKDLNFMSNQCLNRVENDYNSENMVKKTITFIKKFT